MTQTTAPRRKKLIEVALPLEAINAQSAREKSIRHGHPSTLHLWWARRPLAACRAVLFAQLVDDPGSDPQFRNADGGVDLERAGLRRAGLFNLIEELVKWENSNNPRILNAARAEIAASLASRKIFDTHEWKKDQLIEGARAWDYVCRLAKPKQVDALLARHAPPVLDPFAGGGSIPLEAQRLGLRAHASDLNPVPVLINKALIEIPPRFAGRPPVRRVGTAHHDAQVGRAHPTLEQWPGAAGLAEDVRHYGQWMRDEAQKRIGHLYPKVKITQEMVDGVKSPSSPSPVSSLLSSVSCLLSPASSPPPPASSPPPPVPRPDLQPYVGQELTVIAWLWARTVKCANPGCGCRMPMLRSFWLSTKKGKEAWADPILDRKAGTVRFAIRFKGTPPEETSNRTMARCLFCGSIMKKGELRKSASEHGMAEIPLAIVAEGRHGRIYLESTATDLPKVAKPIVAELTQLITDDKRWFSPPQYGLPTFADLFTPRQLTALTTFSDLVGEARAKVLADARAAWEGVEGLKDVIEGRKDGIEGRKDVVEGLKDVVEGRKDVVEGLKDVVEGLKDVVEGRKDVVEGRMDVVEGLKDVIEGRKDVVEGLKDVVEGLKDVIEGRKDGIEGRKDGIESLKDGVKPLGAGEMAAAEGLAGLSDDTRPLADGGSGPQAYADAVATYLAFVVDKLADLGNSLNRWEPNAQCPRQLFARQAMPMVWDFAEGNPFSESSGSWSVLFRNLHGAFESPLFDFERPKEADARQANVTEDATYAIERVAQRDATDETTYAMVPIISCDPPYYDNIGYADLSDFFYVWLRRTLKEVYPDLLGTMLTPKSEEMIASPYRHGGSKAKAAAFFEDGLGSAIGQWRQHGCADYPTTIFYAFKQSETDDAGTASTGWETFLSGVIGHGFSITGTWPIRTECGSRMVGQGTNALASSVVLACVPRAENAPAATRREFLNSLKAELPEAMRKLQSGNIAPVDLAQAAIGPGMGVFSRYSKVLEADGSAMGVRGALVLINQMLDEVLAEQEGEFDADTRWALAWFEQFGMNEGPYGQAETLSKAKNTSVQGLAEAGVVMARSGKVKLMGREAMPGDWDPATDKHPTTWEATQHLIRKLQEQGEAAAGQLLAKLSGDRAEQARDLAYRLYHVAERKGWAGEATAYNGLVVAWLEISKLARGQETGGRRQEMGALFG